MHLPYLTGTGKNIDILLPASSCIYSGIKNAALLSKAGGAFIAGFVFLYQPYSLVRDHDLPLTGLFRFFGNLFLIGLQAFEDRLPVFQRQNSVFPALCFLLFPCGLRFGRRLFDGWPGC